jgi:hypothetical protein
VSARCIAKAKAQTTRWGKWGGEEGQYEVGRSKKGTGASSKTKVRRLIYRMMRPCLTWATVMTIGQGMVDGISGAMGLGDCGSEGLSWREQSKAHQKKPTQRRGFVKMLTKLEKE